MHRLLPPLTRTLRAALRHAPATLLWIAVTATVFAPRAAAAQARPSASAAAAPPDVCAETKRELDATRRSLEETMRTATSASREGAECNQELATATEKLSQASSATKSCQKDKERVCAATSSFVDGLAKGQTKGAAETGCVTPEQQARVDGYYAGTTNAANWLAQLASFQAGETDALPRPLGGSTPVERALQRLAQGGARPAMYRRLLVEAIEIMAPEAWQAIRARGPAAIDTWFKTATPLDGAITTEAARAEAAGARSLSGALHLIRAYEVAMGCAAAPGSGECGRARQLQQLLEKAGSLVVRRRVQDIWATECSAVASESIAPWFDDVVAPRPEDAASARAEIDEAIQGKLFTCYLDDSESRETYRAWLATILPSSTLLTGGRRERVNALTTSWRDDGPEATCARAVRAMQTVPAQSRCAIPSAEFRDALDAWSTLVAQSGRATANGVAPVNGAAPANGAPPANGAAPANGTAESSSLRVCSQLARVLWEGKPASIAGAFAHPPSVEDMVVTDKELPDTSMSRLRAACDTRMGDPSRFVDDLSTLATFARNLGEGTDGAPFRVDPASLRPVETLRYEAARGYGPWIANVTQGTSACTTLGLTNERCRRCAEMPENSAYDCALTMRLDRSFGDRSRGALGALVLFAAVLAGAIWARRWRVARATFASWSRDTATFFDGIGLGTRAPRLRDLFPSRYDAMELSLPSDPAWERWGKRAVVVRTPHGARVVERDVNHAAFVARRAGASVALLEHDDDASPDLSAVRAQLEWAAKGGSRAVQILPIAEGRARWSKSAHDVLDLVEESSLRGNPFELRGRIATSTQFFNRERLVSGLLAAAQAGHWMVLTGLRRFGKSSLALEVARRLPGPSAYVDLAGFDHDIDSEADSAIAATAILRFVCVRLIESARARWPKAEMPAAPNDPLDAAELTRFFRDLSRACQEASGRPAPVLVILDEIEQALGAFPKKLAHALEVLALVIGRLKSAVGDAALPDGGSPIGVFLASAMHPLLWAPLRTLAHQSIMSTCQRVCVPCLNEEAATTMMRSLGARQGIRFTDAALAKIVDESQGVAILLRRLGASVLELYDGERARQGSLGAVEVGVEGATEAVLREAREGSPLRVWIESEIAPRKSVAGALLRKLAAEGSVPVATLCAVAKRMIEADFAHTGVAVTLEEDELERRAEEAAHVLVQLLGESGLLAAEGDLTAPEAYSLPDGAIRRVLCSHASVAAIAVKGAHE